MDMIVIAAVAFLSGGAVALGGMWVLGSAMMMDVEDG